MSSTDLQDIQTSIGSEVGAAIAAVAEVETITLYCDGLCEPMNPGGYACYGWVALDSSRKVLQEGCGFLGRGAAYTNNVAEYTAALEALRWAYRNGYRRVVLRSDSQLLIKQASGKWRCHAAHLLRLLERVQKAAELMDITFEWVRRDRNKKADALSRRAYVEAREQQRAAVRSRKESNPHDLANYLSKEPQK